MSAAHPALVVGAAVVDDLDHPSRLLAARRIGPPDLAGRWELPGGKVEPGELPRDALRREVMEELGVAATIGAELPGPVRGCWPISADLTMRVWLAEVDGEPVVRGAHDLVRWLAPAQWDDVQWLPADIPVLDQLRLRWLRGPAADRTP